MLLREMPLLVRLDERGEETLGGGEGEVRQAQSLEID